MERTVQYSLLQSTHIIRAIAILRESIHHVKRIYLQKASSAWGNRNIGHTVV